MGGPWAKVRSAAADRRSGAAEIARSAAEAVAELDHREAWKAIRLLLTGHPAMAPLWRLATDVLEADDPAAGCARFLERLDGDAEAGAALAPALPPWVLTISYSSSVVATLRRARRLRLVTCMESRPGGEGRRTAEALEASGIPARVMPDDEALRQVPAGAVVVGADAVTPSGVVNKVKTRALAEAARARGIACYAVAGEAKFVGRMLPVEEPFEAVPLELFDAIAVPSGLLSPAQAAARAERASLQAKLLALLGELAGRKR